MVKMYIFSKRDCLTAIRWQLQLVVLRKAYAWFESLYKVFRNLVSLCKILLVTLASINYMTCQWKGGDAL
jgi:hypothetical protein